MQKIGRFLFLLGLSLWLGGFVFFGAVAAPALFWVARQNDAFEIAPLSVARILTRFAVFATVCGAVALIGWLLDSPRDRFWKWRGLTLGAAFLLASAQNFFFTPRAIEEQRAILPLAARAERKQSLSPPEKERLAEFNVRHKRSERLGGITVILLLLSLGAFVGGVSPRTVEDLKN